MSDGGSSSSGWMAATPGAGRLLQHQPSQQQLQLNLTPRLTSGGGARASKVAGAGSSNESSRNGNTTERRHRSGHRSQSRAAGMIPSVSGGPSASAAATGRTVYLNRAVVDLAMDPSLDLLVAPRTRPWRWLLCMLLIVCVYAASDALTALSQSFPAFSGPNKDAFITAAWFVHYAGMACFILGALGTFMTRHPFHWSLLMLYLLALVSFIAASVLHTSRLDVGSSGSGGGGTLLSSPSSGSQRVLAVQLSWVANLAFFVLFGVLVYRAPTTQLKYARAGGPDAEKVRTLFAIREAEQLRAQLAAAIARQDAQLAEDANKEEQHRIMYAALKEAQRLEAAGIHTGGFDAVTSGAAGVATTMGEGAGPADQVSAMVELNSFEGTGTANPSDPALQSQSQLHFLPPPHRRVSSNSTSVGEVVRLFTPGGPGASPPSGGGGGTSGGGGGLIVGGPHHHSDHAHRHHSSHHAPPHQLPHLQPDDQSLMPPHHPQLLFLPSDIQEMDESQQQQPQAAQRDTANRMSVGHVVRASADEEE